MPNLLKKIFGGIYFACTKLYTVAYMEFPVDQIIGKSSDARIQRVGRVDFKPTWNSGVQLTLLQPQQEDYAHHITVCPSGFENLTASLKDGLCCQSSRKAATEYELRNHSTIM